MNYRSQRKSGELHRILRLFEPRSGEGAIRRRDGGTEIAQQSEDRADRRSVSEVGMPLTGAVSVS